MLKVAICTPVHGSPKSPYVRSLGEMLLFSAKSRPDIEFRYFLAGGHLIENRNLLASSALEWGADFNLLIDADIGYPPHAFLRLFQLGLSVVGCNYPQTRNDPPKPTAHRARDGSLEPVYTTEALAREGHVEEVALMGLGLCLISSEALRKLEPPTFRSSPRFGSGLGEDYDLFERLAAVGEKTYIDHALSYDVRHYGEFPYTNALATQLAGK